MLTRATYLALLLAVTLPQLAAEDGKPRDWLLVTNKGDRTLSLIDPALNRQIATVDEKGITGHEVSVSADGRHAFVPIYGDSGVGRPGTDGAVVQVIDLTQRAVTGTVDFGKPVRPHCAVTDPKSGIVYVTTELENTVSVIDPKSLKVLGAIPTGQPESHMLAISRDGRRGYTANVSTGTVSVLDLENRKLLTTIAAAPKVQRIAVSPDDRWVFTADQSKPQLIVIDARTHEVARRIELPDFGYGTAPTPDGRFLLVCMGVGDVGVVDLDAGKVVRSLPVPRAPQAVLIRPDGAVAYVSCDASAKVAVIDLKEWTVTALIDAGKTADGLAWAAASN